MSSKAGVFAPPTGDAISPAGAGDFDGDGISDLLFSRTTYSGLTHSTTGNVMLGKGNGTFSESSPVNLAFSPNFRWVIGRSCQRATCCDSLIGSASSFDWPDRFNDAFSHSEKDIVEVDGGVTVARDELDFVTDVQLSIWFL